MYSHPAASVATAAVEAAAAAGDAARNATAAVEATAAARDVLGIVTTSLPVLQMEEEEPEPWDKRAWTCECYPEGDHEMSTGVPPIPLPPFPDPCCCYGLPEKYLKPGPQAFYLGMGYKAPSMRGPEYLRTPGYFPRQPGQDEYTVTKCGRGLLPPVSIEEARKEPSEIAEIYSISGVDGFQVEVTEYGARIMSIRAPDADGIVRDVLLGFSTPEDYWRNKALHWGGVSGRLADRIRGPQPQLRVQGVGWLLFPQNDEDDHFMGGDLGLDRVIWEAHVQEHGVLFTHLNKAGHEDYPGHVLVTVKYTVLPVNKLEVQMEAMSTAATPFALIQPLVFNLAGHNTGEVAMKEHVLTVHSDKYYATNAAKAYTGAKNHVSSTAYDLRIPRHLRKILRHAPDKSYDVLMCMREPRPGAEKKQRLMARLFHPTCRRVMEVWSDLPVLRLATNLGLTRRPKAPPDPVLLDEARKIILEIIAKITPCEDLLPPRKLRVAPSQKLKSDEEDREALHKQAEKDVVQVILELTEMRPAPNPGDIVTLPIVDREEAKQVVSGILEEILSNVKARPPVYTGFNSYRYYDDCGIMMYPQMPPLLIQKNNLDELVLRPGQRYSHTMTYVFSALPRPPARKRRRFGRRRPFKRASELMIDHCSAAGSREPSQASFTELLDICSVHTSLASI